MDYQAGVCTFCGTGCGHFLKVAEGAAVGVYPARNHPVSRGRLCVRGWNVHELLRTRDRILKPAVGRGQSQEAGWDEAFARAARALSQADPERVAILASPRASNEEAYLLLRLARGVIGTGNLSLDAQSGHYDSLRILAEGTGEQGAMGRFQDIRETDLLLLVDFDVTKQNPIVGSELHMAARAGARLVTLDSRRTQIARLSHRFLQVRPGSTALALAAAARVIRDEGRFDGQWLRERTEGWGEVSAALDRLSLDGLERRLGVPLSEIQELARDLVSARRAMVFYPSGISGLTEDTVRVLFDLFLLAGKVGPGCGVNPVTGLNNLQGACDLGLAPDRLPGFRSLGDPQAAADLRAVWGSHPPLRSGRRVFDLLSREAPLDVLLVVDHDEGIVRYPEAVRRAGHVIFVGSYRNVFEQYADVVLPVASYAETEGTFTSADRRVQLSPRKYDPPSGVPEGWELYCRLAGKLGRRWEYSGPAAIFDEICRVNPFYRGLSHGEAGKLGGVRWPEQHGMDSGRRFRFAPLDPVFQPAEPKPDFPFLLMIGKAQHYWHQNNLMGKTYLPRREYNATLLLYPDGFIEISQKDVAELKVRDKWPVRVTSSAGSMQIRVKVSDDVRPGTAYVPYFVKGMISRFLLEHRQEMRMGENASIPIRIERIP